MHATHLLYLPVSWVVLPEHCPVEVETFQVLVPLIPGVSTGFWEENEYPPRLSSGGELTLDVPNPNNFSRLCEIKDSLLLAVEQCHEAEQEDGYPEWLRFRLEQALDILQGDIEGRRLPSGLPAWNPVTATAEIREVA